MSCWKNNPITACEQTSSTTPPKSKKDGKESKEGKEMKEQTIFCIDINRYKQGYK